MSCIGGRNHARWKRRKVTWLEGSENGDGTTATINTSNGHLSDAWNFYKQTLPKKSDTPIEDEDMEEDEDDDILDEGEIDENSEEQDDLSVR